MLLRMLPLLGFLLAGSVHAANFPIEIIEYIDNARVVAFINEDDIGKTQEWRSFEGEPPLEAGAALKALQQYLVDEMESSSIRLTGIELKRIPHHERHWHYLVKIQVTANDATHARYFVVLMDGKVIPALKEPESFK